MKASKLFCNDEGNEKCYFCNSECSNNILVSSFLKKTFTNYNLIMNNQSSYMCKGCYYSMTDKSIKKLLMPDGELKENQSARTYSWLLTKNNKKPFSKKHNNELKQSILSPPPSFPFSIIITISGKKHLIFRAPVSFTKDNYFLQFEEEEVYINIKQLEKRINLCEKIISYCGKIGILKYSEFQIAKYCLDKVNDNLLGNFFLIRKERLTELAIFLSRNKEKSNECYSFEK